MKNNKTNQLFRFTYLKLLVFALFSVFPFPGFAQASAETATQYATRIAKKFDIPINKIYYVTNQRNKSNPPTNEERQLINFVKGNQSVSYKISNIENLTKTTIEKDLSPPNEFKTFIIKQLQSKTQLPIGRNHLLGILVYTDEVAKYIDYQPYLKFLKILKKEYGIDFVIIAAESAKKIKGVSDIQGM